MRKVLILLASLALIAVSATAGAPSMEEMQKEMANCHVCSNMMPYMGELMPAMNVEIVKLDKGMAVVHSITDDSKLTMYREMSAKMNMAGEAAMAMTAEAASESLCGLCVGMHSAVASGASMSVGDTKNGCVLIFTSESEEGQTEIASMHEMWSHSLMQHQ